MNPIIISSAIAFALGFGGAWQLQQGNIDHAENIRLQQAQADQQRIHALEQARSSKVITAQDNNRKRQVTRANDLATTNTASDSLRVTTADTVRDAGISTDACPDKAQSLAIVFAECQSALVQMGTDAEEWFSEYQLMIEASSK